MANIPIGEKTEVDMRVSTAYSSTQQHKSKWVQYAIVVVILLVFLFVFHRPSSTSPASSSTSSISIFGNGKNTKIIKAATWNIAAINNNPFEYWITSDDPQYNHLMSNVSSFIVAPGSQDIKIREVFTESMVTELVELLKDAFPTSAEQIKTYYEQNFADKSIVSGFIKDGIIGKKRLVSMPDRVTNTINTADGKTVLRPTVINCFQGDLHDVKTWWKEWKYFVFQEEVTIKKASKTKSNSSTPSPAVITKTKIFQMIPKIEKAKYPSITVEEEAMSAPLSVLSLAIFDAILVHMMNLISSQYHMNWQMMRNQMCQMLNFKKNDRVLSILDTTYGDSDLVFLQEVAGNFLSFTKDKAISHLFDIHQSQYMDPDRDQNSFIMFKKGKYREVVEVTKEVTDILQLQVNAEHGNIPSKLPTVAGDLIVLVAMDADDKTKYIFASFHGDTNG